MVSKVMMAVHQGVSSNAGRSMKEIEVNIGKEGKLLREFFYKHHQTHFLEMILVKELKLKNDII